MAARTVKIRHDENTRQKIRTSQILNRLTDHVLGSVEMSPSQVSAGLGLLRKTLPDLANTQISGDPNNPVTVVSRIERVIVRPADPDAGGI
jgi:hypothetical protein